MRTLVARCSAVLVTLAAGVWGSAGSRLAMEETPAIDVGGDRTQVGFDAPVEVTVTANGARARAGEIEWRQIEGPPLAAIEPQDRGFRLRVRTLPFAALHPDPVPTGIVPISPRTQGRYVVEALWRGPGYAPIRRTVTITSIARATGIPSLAVTQAVLLGGGGWHVAVAARAGRAQVEVDGELERFAPDAAGEWVLEGADGQRLTLHASTHDKTPYDCGRSGCHGALADAAVPTPMSHALERRLAAPHSALSEVTCTLDCHAVGERGLRDGGFLDTARALGFAWSEGTTWEALPRPLRRLGGVRCTSCHGPGAIPSRDARNRVLRSDVCATCHDAPPAYMHVAEWKASRMAASDARPETRAEPCRGCHTTAGFLAAQGIRKEEPDAEDDEGTGIACAACHAPHAAHTGDALIRAVGPGGTSSLCVPCHSPRAGEPSPSASNAALWVGRALLPDGDVKTGAAPHAGVPGGCTGCHGKRSGHAVDHSFRVDTATCAACHGGEAPRERPEADGWLVRDRATTLLFSLRARMARGSSARLQRALYEVELVAADPAAGVHNAPYARSLLFDAASILEGP